MATFTNRATLSFAGGTVDSNTVTGEILETLSGSKTAVVDQYTAGDSITYLVSLRNSGTTALTGLTVTDNLGAYDFSGTTLYPLTYTAGSLNYFVNGVQQAPPAVTAGPPLSVTGISIPAGGTAMLVYQVSVNDYAPLTAESTVINTATVSGGGLTAPVTLTETVTAAAQAQLSISKALCPAVVSDNGQLTYTFVIQNSGNTPAVATDDLVVTDTFDPILNPITVTYNGTVWTEGTEYTYDTASGAFATVAGQITVPAATYTQNADGTWTVDPGVSTLVVTGTV